MQAPLSEGDILCIYIHFIWTGWGDCQSRITVGFEQSLAGDSGVFTCIVFCDIFETDTRIVIRVCCSLKALKSV